MSEMSEELKPCPFCGGEEIRKHILAKSIVIQCGRCGAEVMGSTLNSNTTCQMNRVEIDVEFKWNTRHDKNQETIAQLKENQLIAIQALKDIANNGKLDKLDMAELAFDVLLKMNKGNKQ